MAVQPPRWSRTGGDIFRSIPVTSVIIGIWILGFFVAVFTPPGQPTLVASLFAFKPALPNIITGLVTYPLVMGNNIIGAIFSILILYWFGGSLERSWGARRYLVFLIGASAAAAIIWQLGLFIIGHSLRSMADPWLLLSSVIVAWAWLNPEQTILLYFILPLKAKWVGWLTIVLLFISYPMQAIKGPLSFLLGIFALGGIAFAYYFVWYQRKWAWVPRRRGQRTRTRTIRHPSSTFFGALLRPFREWQRRRRVAHLQRTIRFDD